ncbi:MAG: neutral/alkaline non-lysosomal ceramidase N-terminal domain-containing protein, partial [Mariniphaga sp.]|nr:neutral/alkaline non-lysosomal ceramidase N-terminal domain-containing protein [Mariniphaga sp.]
MKKFFKIFGILLLLALVVFSFWSYSNLKDRHPGYSVDLNIRNNSPSELKAGFAAVPITPEVPDRWEDKNGDGKYNPKDGDTFTDGNGNGKFDPVWIAGFSNNKPANGVHDDTWARTMVIDDGKTRLALVILDVIGFMHDDVVDVRKMLPEDLGLTYTIIASTHTHEGPDLMGLWGKHPLKSGVDKTYMQFVKEQTVKSVETAVRNLRPARLEISQDLTGAIPQVKDTRMPEVFDSGLRFIKAVDKE